MTIAAKIILACALQTAARFDSASGAEAVTSGYNEFDRLQSAAVQVQWQAGAER